MFLLKHHRKQWYGKGTDHPLPDDEDEDRDCDPGIMLDGGISRIEWQAEDEADEDPDAGDEPREDGDSGE